VHKLSCDASSIRSGGFGVQATIPNWGSVALSQGPNLSQGKRAATPTPRDADRSNFKLSFSAILVAAEAAKET
jgi:hypothetical protein